jgi:lipid-A-disaccharide synthase
MVDALLPRFVEIHERLRRDASARAADAVAELIASTPRDTGPVSIAP